MDDQVWAVTALASYAEIGVERFTTCFDCILIPAEHEEYFIVTGYVDHEPRETDDGYEAIHCDICGYSEQIQLY